MKPVPTDYHKQHVRESICYYVVMEFGLKVALSFFVGGAYVSGILWFSERLGSRIGGAIAGIPSTLFISLAFISVTEGSKAARSATTIIPIMIVAALFYGWIFIQVASLYKTARRHLWATIGATLAWLLVSVGIRALFSGVNFAYIVLAAVIGIGAFYAYFRRFPPVQPKKISLPHAIYVTRFLTAGLVIAGAVLAARLLGPLWGGVVSSFPATIASSLYFLNKSQGCAFTKSFVRHLPFAFVSTILFIIVLHQTLTRMPTFASFAIGMASALAYTYGLVSLKQR